jgi:hypothetical protein
MELTLGSETSTHSNQTPWLYAKENTLKSEWLVGLFIQEYFYGSKLAHKEKNSVKENSSFLTYYTVSKDCLTLKVEVLFSTSIYPSIKGNASTDLNHDCSESEIL